MNYAVEERKGLKGKKYVVIDKNLNINERWLFEAYLLKIEADKDGDIVLPYIDYLNDKYNSVLFERDSIIDSKRSCFTGMSVITVSFTDKNEAQDYADILNAAK